MYRLAINLPQFGQKIKVTVHWVASEGREVNGSIITVMIKSNSLVDTKSQFQLLMKLFDNLFGTSM